MTTPNTHFPRIAVAALIEHQGSILLIQRGTPPNQGLWTLPGGKVMPGETLAQALRREIVEETGIEVRCLGLIHHFEVIQTDTSGELKFHYVILDFRAEYLGGTLTAGDDALQAQWLNPDECSSIPLEKETRRLLVKENFLPPLSTDIS